MATTPQPRLARLLQPRPPPDRRTSPNATMDLTIELARTRAAAATMASALGVIAITSGNAFLTRTAEDALDRAVQILE